VVKNCYLKGFVHIIIINEMWVITLNDNQNAVVLWTMHPWERDARLAKEAVKKGPQSYGIIIEIACTRSAEELLGARRAYHSLFDQSMEEDVAQHINGCERKVSIINFIA
jgi:hypothetical protein